MLTRVQLISVLVIALGVVVYRLSLALSYHHPSPRLVPPSVDLLTATTQDLLQLLQDGTVTSVQLVSEYQRRINRDNRAGLWLNAMLSTTPPDTINALAKERDEQRRQGKILGPLHGIPFVVKV
jgi:hypothetical protein